MNSHPSSTQSTQDNSNNFDTGLLRDLGVTYFSVTYLYGGPVESLRLPVESLRLNVDGTLNVSKFLKALRESVSPSPQEKALQTIKAFFDHLEESRYVQQNRCVTNHCGFFVEAKNALELLGA